MRLSKSTRVTGMVVAALSLVATHASAGHDLRMTISSNPTTAGAVADVTIFVDFGSSNEPASGISHFPAGVLLPDSSNKPNNGDVVGSVTAKGDLIVNLCNDPAETQTYTIKYVTPMSAGAPSGAVGQLSIEGSFWGLTITKTAWVIERTDSFIGTTHRDIEVPDMPDENYCNTSDQEMTITGYGYSRSGGVPTTRVMGRNPSPAGTYTGYYSYTDTAGGSHSDSATFTTT